MSANDGCAGLTAMEPSHQATRGAPGPSRVKDAFQPSCFRSSWDLMRDALLPMPLYDVTTGRRPEFRGRVGFTAET